MEINTNMLFLFFVYAFIGWIVEVAFHVLTVGKFINRGFLVGPYCPIYGFGMIFIFALLDPFMGNLPIVFLLSILITTAIELFGGFALEKCFHKRWWDYSNEKYNLDGYICLKFSLYWGIGALIVIELVQPVVNAFYKYMPHIFVMIFIAVMFSMMLVDFVYTVVKIMGMNKELEELTMLENKIELVSKNIGDVVTDRVKKSERDGEKLRENYASAKANYDARSEKLRENYASAKANYDARSEKLRENYVSAKAEYDARNEKLRENYESLKSEYNERLELLAKKHHRMLVAFPDIKSLKDRNSFERLKNKIKL